MRLIFSRKGFDSSSGGCPNPILPDGRLLPLPIPDPDSPTRYGDLQHPQLDLGQLVSDLTRGRHRPEQGAHLDPDLLVETLPRQPGWQPCFGQSGAAQGHLQRQQVQPGDLFLFFGLFRPVESGPQGWQFVPGTPAVHRLWGWLQIGACHDLHAGIDPELRSWAADHPHLQRRQRNNGLYVARPQLQLQGGTSGLPGSGQFSHACPEHQLTAPGAPSPSYWQLPAWLHPGPNMPTLSYHQRAERWSRQGETCQLRCVNRGQEFVVDISREPAAVPWLQWLLSRP